MAGYGKSKSKDSGAGLERLRADIKNGTPRPLYAFFGEERYLLEDAVRRLRAMIPEGTEEFNHHVLEGRSLDINALAEAVDAFPAFSERTLIEINDFDFSKAGEDTRAALLRVLTDIPGYATVVFIFDSVEFKLDGRIKAYQELRRHLVEVEFAPQSQAALTNWMVKHFASAGKRITRPAAERLIAMTGGLMTGLRTELEKLIAYVKGDTVDVADVEAIVAPIPEAAAWELTDALIAGRGDLAMERLGELIKLNEDAHKLIFSVSLKLRQLTAARVCLDERMTVREFMALCDVRFDFQARALFDAARKLTLDTCAKMCGICANMAYRLNSSVRSDRELLSDLVIRLLAAR